MARVEASAKTKSDLACQMLRRTIKQGLKDKGLSKKLFGLFVSPILCWEILEENHQLLKIHFSQLKTNNYKAYKCRAKDLPEARNLKGVQRTHTHGTH